MKKRLCALLFCLILPASLQAQLTIERGPLRMFPGPATDQTRDIATSPADPSLPFVDSARTMIVEQKYDQAKEALRTALRISPMDMQIWALYDETVTADYVEKKRQERFNPVIYGDISPVFSINRIDSYIELDTLFVVGTIQNTSKATRQKIVLSGSILDENKRELRRETGTLLIPERGLMPNESSIFEIPFKNFPPGGKSYRVEVKSYE
ncbi:MAG: hypothetical protein CVV42_13645 [Candidatus Riflebacteria bacterium HGW-Riflebacteria-2]|jgi:hypothetical protein|nr:MAG: hypothetical protein CVV42_13645 [Candidatus Riflebacteria bacterium HGW-Riflebacteria-2]